MSAELIGILSVGVALAALHLSTLSGTRTELRTDISDVRGELRDVRDELRDDIHAADDRIRTQEQSTANLEGLLEGLREAAVVHAGDSEQRCGADRLPGACRAEDGPCGCIQRAARQQGVCPRRRRYSPPAVSRHRGAR